MTNFNSVVLTLDSHLFTRNSSHGRLHLRGHVEEFFWGTGYGHGVVVLDKALSRDLVQNELLRISHSQSPVFAPHPPRQRRRVAAAVESFRVSGRRPPRPLNPSPVLPAAAAEDVKVKSGTSFVLEGNPSFLPLTRRVS